MSGVNGGSANARQHRGKVSIKKWVQNQAHDVLADTYIAIVIVCILHLHQLLGGFDFV
jgi:hypothetical protein